jgi:hypothetical protein
MKFKLPWTSSMRAVMLHTRTSRIGSARGGARVSERRRACDHRLVAASDRAPRAPSLVHRARQSQGGQSNRGHTARCCGASRPTAESGPSWSSRRYARTGRARHARRDSLQAPKRPSRGHRGLSRPAEMAEASVSLWTPASPMGLGASGWIQAHDAGCVIRVRRLARSGPTLPQRRQLRWLVRRAHRPVRDVRR